MLTHAACSPMSPRGWLKCPEEVMCAQLGALEPRTENISDGVKEILILVGRGIWSGFVVVSASMLKELTAWRCLHQTEMLQ